MGIPDDIFYAMMGGKGSKGDKGKGSKNGKLVRKDDAGTKAGVKEHKGNMNCKLYVGNLSYKTNWHGLKEYFEGQGFTVEFSKVMREDSPQGKRGAWSRGWGIVEVGSPAEARKAIKQLNESELDGRNII